MIFCRKVEISIIRLDSDDLGPVVLIFVIGLDGGDLFEGYFFSGFFIDLLLNEAVEVSFGEDHPPFFPFFEDAGSFD